MSVTRYALGALLTLTLGTMPAVAQDSVRCTSDRYGTLTTTRCYGVRPTSERIGGTVYTRNNTGYRSTLEEIGSSAYYRSNTDVRGTLDTYGSSTSDFSSTTYRDNTGRRATVDRYELSCGSTSYYRDNEGTRATVDAYGRRAVGRITTPLVSGVLPPLNSPRRGQALWEAASGMTHTAAALSATWRSAAFFAVEHRAVSLFQTPKRRCRNDLPADGDIAPRD